VTVVCRERVRLRARTYEGVKEHPPGSNRGKHIDRWCRWAAGVTGYAWCAAFVCGMVREACGLIVPEPRRASVGFLEAWAKRIGKLLKPGVRPIPGDLVCYRFDPDDWPDHVGIVDKVLAVRWRKGAFLGAIRTIEGNTSGSDDANGGQVQIRFRSALRCSFIRLDAQKLQPVRGG